MEWSKYQLAIFDAIEHTNDSLLVEAVAGSGKTTTIVEAINHVPSTQSVCFLAFNKAIAETLKSRVKAKNARCATLHSVGNAAWKGQLGWDANNCELNTRKTSDIVSTTLNSQQRFKYGGQMSKLISIAKGQGIVPSGLEDNFANVHGLVEDSDYVWEEMIDFYGLDPDECDIELARAVLRRSIQVSTTMIDFDDMLYMPVIARSSFETYDVVFLDEAQDVNSMQVEIVDRMVSTVGRVIAVGDPHQAIYGFRGALSESMNHIANRFECKRLPLSVSYRCPKSVVKHAQELVSHILHFEHAPDGLVQTDDVWKPKDFLKTDAILCRVNKPLVSLAFLLIREKVPCRVMGRDIGNNLVALVKKMKAADIMDLDAKLTKYRGREALRAKADASKLAALDDKIETLRVFVDELGPDGTLAELTKSIGALFSDGDSSSTKPMWGQMVTLSTVHKAKGLDWDRVFILDAPSTMPSPWAKQKWQHDQEVNLQYVARTRTKMELHYVTSEGIRVGTMPEHAYDETNS